MSVVMSTPPSSVTPPAGDSFRPNPRTWGRPPVERPLAMRSWPAARYARWDGTQSSALDADETSTPWPTTSWPRAICRSLRRLMERGLATGDPTRPDLAS
jgi:hypothetical protein